MFLIIFISIIFGVQVVSGYTDKFFSGAFLHFGAPITRAVNPVYSLLLLTLLPAFLGVSKVHYIILSFFFFETEFRSCYPGWSAMARSWLTATSAS